MRQSNLVLLILGIALSFCGCKPDHLMNQYLDIQFSDHGIGSIYSEELGEEIQILTDDFTISVNGKLFSSKGVKPDKVTTSPVKRTYQYKIENATIEAVYELQADWKFVSKQILIKTRDEGPYFVDQVSPFVGSISNDPDEIFKLTDGKYGLSLRFRDDQEPGYGMFLLVQNPYTSYSASREPGIEIDDGKTNVISARYDAMMNWEGAYGDFVGDRMCLGVYPLSGQTFRQDMISEWEYHEDPDKILTEGKQVDYAEINAVTDCARAFLLQDRNESIRVHIGWCENDYQIDMANPEDRAQYKRIIDQAAAIGSQYVLYTPGHSGINLQSDSRDAWGWENLLWLNMGIKIRKGEWLPYRDKLPADIQEIIDYASAKNIKLMAYVYPSLPFMQNPDWTAWQTKKGNEPQGYLTVDTGLRSYQDWLIDLLLDFHDYAGIGGFSFDHWWIAYEDENGLVSSKYQQWFGTRRILEELRKQAPEIILDGRQQYHHFGTWTWLAGSYPHPMMSDEQPGSFNSMIDLSTDRVSGARQRFVAWRLMTREYTPIEILSGFITHQTQRSDADRVMRRDHYRLKDWDFLGWKYNLLSSIATAPFNHVINYLPARDQQEFDAFSQADKDFFNFWLDFTDQNMAYLKNIRPILDQPMVGSCDGTSAILEDEGYLFVFNPNYREMEANLTLNHSIGLLSGEEFLLSEIYPQQDMNLAKPGAGFYKFGDELQLRMDGTSCRILKIQAIDKHPAKALLFNSPGTVAIDNETLVLSDVEGLVGETRELMVLLPDKYSSRSGFDKVVVNGNETKFETDGSVVHIQVRFEGNYFKQSQQLDYYENNRNIEETELMFSLPERIKEQMLRHKKAWPVDYSEDDLMAPWTDPSRLLLYIQIAEPYRDTTIIQLRNGEEISSIRKVPISKAEIAVHIDEDVYEVKEAYNGIYPYVTRTFMGFYVDISDLSCDEPHNLYLKLPKGLKPGQFQGIFVEHVENEYTKSVTRVHAHQNLTVLFSQYSDETH